MAETNKTNNNTNNIPEVVQVNVVEVEEFDHIQEIRTLTSVDLERKIAKFFKSIFADFDGCKIIPIQVQGKPVSLKCKVYFKPCMNKADDGLYAVKVRGESKIFKPNSKKLQVSEVVDTVNMLSSSKLFDLEDVAKEILAEYIIIRDAKMVDRYNKELNKVVKVRLPKNWNIYIEEIANRIPNTNMQDPVLGVTLDLLPLVAKLYGKKDPEEVKALSSKGLIPKDRYQYEVNIVKSLNPQRYSFLLEIKRMDLVEMNKLAQSIGYGLVTGNIIMTRV